MDRTKISENIKEIMADVLDVEIEDLADDIGIGDIPEWDSLHHLRILTEIENEYGIHFSPDVLKNFEDISDIIEAVISELNV